MSAPTLRACRVTHPDFAPFWLASVVYAGHVFNVEGYYRSEWKANQAAAVVANDIVRRCTPEYLAMLDRRANEPSPGSRVVVVGGTL